RVLEEALFATLSTTAAQTPSCRSYFRNKSGWYTSIELKLVGSSHFSPSTEADRFSGCRLDCPGGEAAVGPSTFHTCRRSKIVDMGWPRWLQRPVAKDFASSNWHCPPPQ